jgi:hypothetical protein
LVVVLPMDGATVGSSTNVFGIKCTTPQAAATATFDILGYEF